MKKEESIIWFAGLFEGEGTFCVANNKCKGLALTSTDKDVLDQIQIYFGGSIYFYNSKVHKEHWKDQYIWKLRSQASIDLYNSIRPYLLSRRKQRGDEWVKMWDNAKEKANLKTGLKENKRKEIFKLKELGYSHQYIADTVGYERSSITRILLNQR